MRPDLIALESEFASAAEAGRTAWPGVGLSTDVFARHLAGVLRDDRNPRETLRALEVSDLYLACACAEGDGRALQAFDARHMAEAASYLSRIESRRDVVAEVTQMLRARLLIADGRDRPRIADYGGRGPLRSWVRRAAVRALYNHHRGEKVERALVPEAGSLHTAAPDPEILYFKVRYGPELDRAFRSAIGSLSERDATLLQLYFVGEVTADALASMYRTTERTVRRWLAGARKSIMDETRRRLSEQLNISNTECKSLLVALQSQLDLSIQTLLKEPRQ